MTRTRLVLIPAALSLAAGLALSACGSSGGTTDQLAGSQPTSTAAASTPADSASASASGSASAGGPTLVAASQVPAVTGKQGAKPTIAKATLAAPSTLEAHDVIVGTGATLASGGTATANYTLELYDGTPVQSSYDGSGPFPFTAAQGGVIDGFAEGVVGMKVGGRRELIIPPSLGYGAADQNGIPGNSTLIFVVDLVSVGS